MEDFFTFCAVEIDPDWKDSLDDCYCISIYRLSIGQAIAYEYTGGVVGLSPMVIHVEQFREICGDPLFCELKKHIMKYDELLKYY